MRKTGLFLSVAAMALVIAFISCSNPVFPDGSSTGRSITQTQPGYTVIEQLEWLQENARTNGNYVVVARLNEPRIPGNNNFGISYGTRENITVTITSDTGIPRQTLRLLDSGVMLDVSAGNTLILQNINLQVSDAFERNAPIVVVYNGTLKMTNASISGNEGTYFRNDGERGVALRDEGTLIMSYGAEIYGNRGGVSVVEESRVYMYGNALIHNNTAFWPWPPTGIGLLQSFGGGVVLHEGTITMRGDAKIYANNADAGGGIAAWPGFIYMYDNAAIHGNSSSSGGGVHMETWPPLWNSALNMHGNNVRISANSSNAGRGGGGGAGGLFLSGVISVLYISGGTIYGVNALPHLANIASNFSNAAMFRSSGAIIRVGSYSSDGGFIPCGFTNVVIQDFNSTFRVIDGELQ